MSGIICAHTVAVVSKSSFCMFGIAVVNMANMLAISFCVIVITSLFFVPYGIFKCHIILRRHCRIIDIGVRTFRRSLQALHSYIIAVCRSAADMSANRCIRRYGWHWLNADRLFIFPASPV